MPSYSRIAVPENFYDVTSELLLVQPESQYFYADLYLGALQTSLSVPPELGLPGRAVGGSGADYSPLERHQLMLSSPMFTDVMGAKVNFAAEPGNTVRINRPSFTNTTYTADSRLVASGTSISTTPVTIASQQTNLTLYRYGGPYDQTNTRVAPFALEAFDANMGVHKAASMHATHLIRDFRKFLDAVWVTLFDLAATAVYPEGMSAVNDATAAGMFPFTYEQLSRVEEAMDTANLPTFGDGFRALVLTTKQVNQLRNDRQYQRAAQNFPAYSILFPGYVSSVNKFHVFKSTTLATTANSSSIAIQYGHAIAPGAGMAGMGRPPSVRPSTDDNYGETAKVIWLADLAFALANNTFVYSVRSAA